MLIYFISVLFILFYTLIILGDFDMSKKTLDQLKNAFAAKTTEGGGDQNWKKFFPFWKMPDDTTCVVRFLPDLDDENPMGFLVENLTHTLIVNGEKKTVPCLSMHGESCPICELSRKYYDEKNEELGKKYYRKKSYIGQILVVESPIEHDQNQLVKLIDFGPKIFKLIQAAFQSGDLEETPYELKGGYNFRIKKTKAGQYSDYGTSSFSPKQSDIDDDVIERLELFNLKDYRGAYVDRATMEAMLMADRTGSTYGASSNDDVPTYAPKAAPAAAPAPKIEAAPVAESTPAPEPAASGKAQDVLAQLRARAAAKKAEGAEG